MSYPLSLMFFLLLIVSTTVQTAYSSNLRGVVLDRKGNAVFGAVVSLQTRGKTDTTDYNGYFSFATTATSYGKTVLPANSVRTVKYVDGTVILENPVYQPVVLTLFDLRGKVIATLYNGHLNAGNHRFSLPSFSRNQTLLINARTGSVTTIHRCIGSFASVTSTGSDLNKRKSARSSDVALDMVSVSHPTFSGTLVPVSSFDDSLTLWLFPKVDYRKAMTMSVGDTLYTSSDEIMLSLDSINDGRCGCTVLCEWEGNAALYFSLRIQDKRTDIILGTYDKKEVTIGGYTFRLMEVKPTCPSSQQQNYRVSVVFYPTATPAKTLLVEHYITRDGTAVSGMCGLLCIDFPTYYFNSDKQELRYMHISSSPSADTTLLIYGSGTTLTGDAGSGAASGLTAVGSLPYTNNNLTLNSISAEGTITVMYGGTSLTIPPGTSWVDTTHARKTDSGDCIVDITTVDRISNFGYLLPYQFLMMN